MDYGMIQGAVTSLKVAADIAIALGNMKTMSEVQAKVIELQQVILSAQSGALAAQSEQFTLLQEIRDLKEEVARAKAWKEQKQRYALIAPWSGAAIYALKRQSAGSEPAHWICTNCYETGRKSILADEHRLQAFGGGGIGIGCQVCKSHISAPDFVKLSRTFAEDA
jgi:hypothetical protein